VDVPKASIPAITFVIPANLPARCHQGNQALRSELPMVAVKARSNKGAIHSPALLQVIRNYNRERTGCC
jgi:hypothetical protein